MTTETNTKTAIKNWNKPAYIALLLAGIYFVIVKDLSQAAIFLGIGLVFDPFDQKLPFPKRPWYQQVWLTVHLAVTLALVIIEIFNK
ncbi:MAG: hypothetical protein ABIN94_07060 [Ferruginibacter sp.]